MSEVSELSAWLDALGAYPASNIPPVPTDALAECIRQRIGLSQMPALALLDEIVALRAERDALRLKVTELEARPQSVVVGGVGIAAEAGATVRVEHQVVKGGVGIRVGSTEGRE